MYFYIDKCDYIIYDLLCEKYNKLKLKQAFIYIVFRIFDELYLPVQMKLYNKIMPCHFKT